MARKKKVVIIGASFAGLAAAGAIPSRYSVRVLDPRPEFQWTPNIHEILSGVKTERDVLLDRETIIRHRGHAFIRDSAVKLDTADRKVETAAGKTLRYDACIVASGGVRDMQGIPGADKYCIGFGTAAEAAAIEKRIRRLVALGKPASVVIIGGGISGIEALGEILRRHRSDEVLDLHVVERETEILPGMPAALVADIRRRAGEYGVNFHVGRTVRRITKTGVAFKGGKSLPADLVIWSAGLSPPAYLAESGLIPTGHRWAPVNQTLVSKVTPQVLVAGDTAELPSALRKQAYHALDMGEYAGNNVQRMFRGRALRRFRASTKPLLVAFGDLDTYLVAGDRVVASPYLAAAKESVYQYYMARLSLGQPPVDFGAGLAARFGGAIRSLVLPEILSGRALRSIRGARILE